MDSIFIVIEVTVRVLWRTEPKGDIYICIHTHTFILSYTFIHVRIYPYIHIYILKQCRQSGCHTECNIVLLYQ